MRRLAFLIPTVSLCLFGAVTCATYKQDLDRARAHYEGKTTEAARKDYEENQYEKALAILRVLEDDIDSFSPGEQAQYAYLRGMTDLRLSQSSRLSQTSTQGGGVADPRLAYRANARHWLGFAAAVEKVTPGGLTNDEKQRLSDAMTDLNQDVFGGEEGTASGADAGTGDAGEDAAAAVVDPAAPASAAPAPAAPAPAAPKP